MKSRRAITVGLTFVAGLYFILDFIVPPTLPGVSVRGVVSTTTPATFSVKSGAFPPIPYEMAGQGALRPQILLAQRDILGAPKLTTATLRQVGVGSIVTVRLGPITIRTVSNGGVTTTEGKRLTLFQGQKWVDGTSNLPVAEPIVGHSLSIEQTGGKVATLDPGEVKFAGPELRTVHLKSNSIVIKLARHGNGTEMQLDDLKTGDTVQIGPNTYFADNRDTAAQFNLVITTMAFGIGLLSLGMYHSKILIKRPSGWYLSVFFFVSVGLGFLAGLGKYQDPGTTSRAFSDFIVLRVIASVTSAIFSLLAFYMASAAYRAFRVRTWEAALMMGSAVIVMLGQTPFGSYLTSWMGERYSDFWLPNIAGWILRVPNTAVFRGLIFGLMMGAIATALRYWLSMERAVSGGD